MECGPVAIVVRGTGCKVDTVYVRPRAVAALRRISQMGGGPMGV
jgi:hypothetical protein